MEDNYEKLCKIGVGSFGEVYLVRKVDSGRSYAMKRSHLQIIARENKIYQLTIEKQVLKALAHPGVIRLRQMFSNDYYIFSVFDLC